MDKTMSEREAFEVLVESTHSPSFYDEYETWQATFKSYVHDHLDKMGVPHSVPESEHDKAGCRVGGRLDWVEQRLAAEREVSDRLLAALKRVVGDHNAPNDCYATGPLTGNSYRDLVECPSCTGEALIAEVEAMRNEK